MAHHPQAQASAQREVDEQLAGHPPVAEDLRRLLAGERVTLSRFDFKAGKSIPAGGHTLEMKPGDVFEIHTPGGGGYGAA